MEPDSAVTYDLFGFHKRAEEVVETYRICGEETYDVEYVCVDPTEHRRSKRDTTSANPAPIVSCHTGGRSFNFPKFFWAIFYFPSAAERYTCHTSADQPFQFTSFDGRSVSFDGDCKYLLSGTPSDNGFSPVPQYQIFLKREQGGRSVAYVEVIFGDNIERINIRLLPGNVIQVWFLGVTKSTIAMFTSSGQRHRDPPSRSSSIFPVFWRRCHHISEDWFKPYINPL